MFLDNVRSVVWLKARINKYMAIPKVSTDWVTQIHSISWLRVALETLVRDLIANQSQPGELYFLMAVSSN